jgi:hypothetical protein
MIVRASRQNHRGNHESNRGSRFRKAVRFFLRLFAKCDRLMKNGCSRPSNICALCAGNKLAAIQKYDRYNPPQSLPLSAFDLSCHCLGGALYFSIHSPAKIMQKLGRPLCTAGFTAPCYTRIRIEQDFPPDCIPNIIFGIAIIAYCKLL